MRKTALLFILLLFSSENFISQTNWSRINPELSDYLRDVQMFDYNTIIVAGANGGIFKTTDGGNEWEQSESILPDDVQNIFFVSSSVGWAVSGTSVYKTVDGGINWSEQKDFAVSLYDVFFVSQSIGWVVGANGFISKTVDGGTTWSTQVGGGYTGTLLSVYFVDSQFGYAVGSNGIKAKTTNGGSNWTITEFSGGLGPHYQSVCFRNSNDGWIVGDCNPLHTTNGGTDWNAPTNIIQADFGNEIMQKIRFFKDGLTVYGIIVGNNGKVACTYDLGDSWTIKDVAPGTNFYSVNAYAKTFFVVGNGGSVYKSTNAGGNWSKVVAPFTTANLNGVFFYSDAFGFVVGDNGEVWRTNNNGSNWTKIALPGKFTDAITGVCFPSDTIGYLCGQDAFFYSGDSGKSWSKLSFNGNPVSMDFLNNNEGWMVGGSSGNGKIWHTTNRGRHWYIKTVSAMLNDVEILNANTVVVCGNSGTLLKTTNDGSSWLTINCGTSQNITALSFPNKNVGFFATDSGSLGKTTDGGNHWTVSSVTFYSISDLFFINENEGWFVADNETYYTNDGGVTWTEESKLSHLRLNAIYFSSPATGYRAGVNGILHQGTNLSAQPIPTAAKPIFPLDNDFDIEAGYGTVILRWKQGGGPQPTNYKLYFGTDGNGVIPPTNIINGADMGNATYWQVNVNLQYNTIYYWQIIPENVNGACLDAPIWLFSTRENPNYGGGGSTAPGIYFANSLPGASGAQSQPSYVWIDPISNNHSIINSWTYGNGDDGYYGQVSLGFTFNFFGTDYTDIYIGSNGILTFGNGYSGNGQNVTIPNNAAPNNMIAPLLMDLSDKDSAGVSRGNVFYATSGNKFIVTWKNYYAKETNDFITFQAILHSDGGIQFQYNDAASTFPLPDTIGNNALIGIEDEFGDCGLQYRNNGVGGPIFGSPMALQFGDNQNNLPVELVSFTARLLNSNEVKLTWQTATEKNNYGFEIQRSLNNGFSEFNTVGFVEGAGNSNSPKQYSFTETLSENGTYFYRLKQIDSDGGFKFSEIIKINIGIPEKFELMQNYPNPFNPATTIKYSVPKQTNITLTVYDILGRKIRTLINRMQKPGKYEIIFEADELPSGIYFYTLHSQAFSVTRKMLLLK